MLDVKLLVVGGDAKSAELRLTLPTSIGRSREATLTLPHPLVSRMHCELFERDGRLFVRDLGSLNGTFVNNERIKMEMAILPEQLLTVGNVTFRAVYELGVEIVGESDLNKNQFVECAGQSAAVADHKTAAKPTLRTSSPVSTQPGPPAAGGRKQSAGVAAVGPAPRTGVAASGVDETVYVPEQGSADPPDDVAARDRSQTPARGVSSKPAISSSVDLDAAVEKQPIKGDSDIANYSVVAAMRDVTDAQPASEVSASQLEQLPQRQVVSADSFDVNVLDGETPRQVGRSFLDKVGEVADDQAGSPIDSNDSSLDEFIRRFPR